MGQVFCDGCDLLTTHDQLSLWDDNERMERLYLCAACAQKKRTEQAARREQERMYE